MDLRFPIFVSEGKQQGELVSRGPDGFQPRGTGQALDHEFFHFRDVTREAVEKERQVDDYFREANPELWEARQALQRCRQTTAHWVAQVNDAQAAVNQQIVRMNGTSPDAVTGTREERGYELVALRAELENAQQEHSAALEEELAAKARVDALVQVSA